MSSLTLELENVISHFEYLTRVAGPRRLSIEAQNKQSQEAQSDSTRCHVAHARKKKLYERPRSFPPSNYLNILLSPRPMWHSSFLVLPTSFHKSRDEISFRGGGCNTMWCGSPNLSLITVISGLVMHYMP
jgi:hypothetical protein